MRGPVVQKWLFFISLLCVTKIGEIFMGHDKRRGQERDIEFE
jgi:hypothetical protein